MWQALRSWKAGYAVWQQSVHGVPGLDTRPLCQGTSVRCTIHIAWSQADYYDAQHAKGQACGRSCSGATTYVMATGCMSSVRLATSCSMP